jgi:hypothetical protein
MPQTFGAGYQTAWILFRRVRFQAKPLSLPTALRFRASGFHSDRLKPDYIGRMLLAHCRRMLPELRLTGKFVIGLSER